MTKKIIIFDMDGVLFDTMPFAEKFFLESHPGVTSEMYKELHSGNFHEEMKKYLHLEKEETEEERTKRYSQYAEKKKEIPMFEGIENLLKDLHRLGYLLALNTNAFDKNCLPLLERSGIKDLFDLIASAEFSKSKIKKFKMIEEKYNADKADMLFVTDALGDIKEAEIAEVPTVAVTWGVHDNIFFKREKHSNLIGIFQTVTELRDFLLQ